MTAKVCNRCGDTKPLSMFAQHGRGKFRAVCKSCINAAAVDRYARDSAYREQKKAHARSIRKDIQNMEPAAVEAIRERRREYKRLGRLRGAPGYKPARHDAHVSCWSDWRASKEVEHQEAERRLLAQLHDAHVKAAGPRVVWLRQEARQETREGRIRRRAVAREQLSDSYIVRLLTNSRKSCPKGAGIPPALIELKRAHLKLKRYLNHEEGEDE